MKKIGPPVGDRKFPLPILLFFYHNIRTTITSFSERALGMENNTLLITAKDIIGYEFNTKLLV